jgi:hypothetical protein
MSPDADVPPPEEPGVLPAIRPPALIAIGDPLQLPAGPAPRRTVAAAADEVPRALAAHVAATRPAPTEPERDQP